MDEIGVMNLIEELSVLIEDSKPVFGKNTMRQVDAQAAFEILDEIRDTFPSEFAQARQIIRERQALLDEAEAQASRLIEDARSQAITIASEQEIVRISQQQADTIMAEALSSSAKRVQVRKTSLMKCSLMSSRASIPRSTVCVVVVTA